jgi:GNAT superfamily N-acetyltransferase
MERLRDATRFKATIAKRPDRPLVARLCRRAVGRSDYILRILPVVIPRGGLFLAWDDGTLVGMTNFEWCIDGNGWLSMARTDPDWRRRGVATFLQREIAAYAKERGASMLRLWVSSWSW